MDLILLAVVGVVALALLFDFTNGFHDAANSTATVVATKALRPRQAVYMAAFFNFAALFVVGTTVANTVAKTVNVDALGTTPDGIPAGLAVAFGALIGAIFWNYLTWSVGMPSSSSPCADRWTGRSRAGCWRIRRHRVEQLWTRPSWPSRSRPWSRSRSRSWRCSWSRCCSGSPIGRTTRSPSSGCRSPPRRRCRSATARTTRRRRWASSPSPWCPADTCPPTKPSRLWVEISAYTMIALGTIWGGWRIIETMGLRITRLNANRASRPTSVRPPRSSGPPSLGIPISTTQAAAASVMGSGAASGSGLNRRKIGEMVVAWIFTLPAAAVVGFLTTKATCCPTRGAGCSAAPACSCCSPGPGG